MDATRNPPVAANSTKQTNETINKPHIESTKSTPTDNIATTSTQTPAANSTTAMESKDDDVADRIANDHNAHEQATKNKKRKSDHIASKNAAKRAKKKHTDLVIADEDAGYSDAEPAPAAASATDTSSLVRFNGSIFGGPFASSARKRKAKDDDETVATKRSKAEVETADADMDVVPPAADPASIDPTEFQADPDKVSFFSMPAEIRLRIYDYLFSDHNNPVIGLPIKPEKIRKPSETVGEPILKDTPRWGFRKGVLTSMARANKQLSREVLHYVYSTRAFQLVVPQHRTWITQIGHPNSSLIKHIILSCKGRAKTAAENLFTTLVAIRKRGSESLISLSLYDNGLSVDSSFLVRQVLEFGERQGWKPFHKLEYINFHFPHPRPPVVDTPLYETLCLQSKTKVASKIYRASSPGGPALPIQHRLQVWLRLDPVKLEHRQREEREARRQANKMRREKWRKAKEAKHKAKQQRWVKTRTETLHATFEEVQQRYRGSFKAKADADMEGAQLGVRV